MSDSEAAVLKRVHLALGGRVDVRLWRNNVGTSWIGEVERRGPDVLIRNARPLHAGLCVGSSDLIGFQRVTVGSHTLARFLAVECKSARGRATEEQRRFLAAVTSAGGLAGIVRSADEALALVEGAW